MIDNSELDAAIQDNLTPDQYPLESLDLQRMEPLKDGHEHGTIVLFDGIRDPIRNTVDYLRKIIALSFRLSLIDQNLAIYVNGEPIPTRNLSDLLDATEFIWFSEAYSDDFTKGMEKLKSNPAPLQFMKGVRGFVASVVKPGDLKIRGTDERATVDLFVNGRLRERSILRHIPSQRIVESYLYGQIHFDGMDREGHDPFTSSREGIVEDDPDFQRLLQYLKSEALPKIFDAWDGLRLVVRRGTTRTPARGAGTPGARRSPRPPWRSRCLGNGEPDSSQQAVLRGVLLR